MSKTLEVDFERQMPADGAPADDVVGFALQRVLACEARLLDSGRYQDWLQFMADDILYWMPIITRRLSHEEPPPPSLRDSATYKDNLDMLRMRVVRLTSGMVWCETPANSQRHHVSNVEVYTTAMPDEYKVYTSVLLYRSRLDSKRKLFSVLREDLWRRDGSRWQLSFRKVTLDDDGVQDSNLNLFF